MMIPKELCKIGNNNIITSITSMYEATILNLHTCCEHVQIVYDRPHTDHASIDGYEAKGQL